MRAAHLLMPLVLALALSLAAVPASAPSVPATLPTWAVGQAVGYGTELNLTALAAPFLNQIRANPSAYNLTAIRALDFTGSFDAWVYDEVTQKTSTYYVLSSDAATGLAIDFNANVTANNLPAPGMYTGDLSSGVCVPPSIPLTTRTIAATIELTSLGTSTGTTRYQVSDLAILNSTTNGASEILAHIEAVGVLSMSTNLTACTVSITYKSESLTLTTNTQVQVRVLYQPALDFFNFTMNDNETWWGNSTATVGATIAGTIDVQGVSVEDQKAFFDNLTRLFQSVPGLAVTGIDHFPLDLAKITATVGGTNVLQNGVLHDQTNPVSLNLRATSAAMTLADGALHPVYRITTAAYLCPSSPGFASSAVAAVYAPDFPAAGAGMVVGYEVVACSGGTQTSVFELKNVPASDARGNVEETKTTYNPFPSTPKNAILDFFVAAPYFGFIIVAAVAVLAIAILLRRRGRKPAAAPPMPPPPGPGT